MEKILRPKIGIVIDYSIRIPDFISCYKILKQQIIDGAVKKMGSDESEDQENLKTNYFSNLYHLDRKAYEFYEKGIFPKKEDLDHSYERYFYCKDDLERFFEAFSFNMYAVSEAVNKNNINLVNICQNKIADVVLIDKISSTRKITSTFAFLAKAKIYVKEVRFTKNDAEFEKIKKELYSTFDYSKEFKDQVVSYEEDENNKLLLWFMKIEDKIKKNLVVKE